MKKAEAKIYNYLATSYNLAMWSFYNNERKSIFYKDAKFNNQYNMKGSLKKECDFYNNCWEFEYEELTGTGRCTYLLTGQRASLTYPFPPSPAILYSYGYI